MPVLLSLGSLVCTMRTSLLAPALNQIGVDLEMQRSVEQPILLIYLLAFVLGSKIIASLSEVFGQKPAYIFAKLPLLAPGVLMVPLDCLSMAREPSKDVGRDRQ